MTIIDYNYKTIHGIYFIDKVSEVETIHNFCKIDIPIPIAIYGPEGCGETELFKYLIHKFKDDKNILVICIDALEESNLEKAIMSNIDIKWFEIIKEISSSIESIDKLII